MPSISQRFKIVFLPFFCLFFATSFAYNESEDIVKGFLLYSKCSFSSEEIVVLSDQANMKFDPSFMLEMNRNLYIKFLKPSNLQFVQDQFVKDMLLENTNLTLSAELVALDQQNNIVTKDYTQKLKLNSNAIIPQGSVLYLSYKQLYPYNGAMPSWRIQHLFPSELSTFSITYPELVGVELAVPKLLVPDFDRTTQIQDNFLINGVPQKISFTERTIQYSQIKPFSIEPFSTFYLDNIPTIKLKLISLKRNLKQKSPETIQEDDGQSLFMDMSSKPDFVLKLNEKFDLPREYNNKILTIQNQSIKLARIFDLVRRHFYAKSKDSLFMEKPTQSFASLWSQRVATPTEINMVLIKVLQIYGFDAVPLLVSTIDRPKVNQAFPKAESFNRVLACVYFNDKVIPLDGSLRYGDFPMISPQVMQRWAFAMTIDHSRWVFIDDLKNKHYDNTILLGDILPKDSLRFFTYVNSYEYSKAERLADLAKDTLMSFSKKYFALKGVKIRHFITANEYVDTLPLAQEFDFTFPFKVENSLLNVKLDYYGVPEKLWEINANRTSAIHLLTRRKYDYLIKVAFPANYEVYILPTTATYTYFNGDVSFKRELHKTENSVSMKYELEINKVTYDEDEVAEFSKALQRIHALLQQEMVLRKKY